MLSFFFLKICQTENKLVIACCRNTDCDRPRQNYYPRNLAEYCKTNGPAANYKRSYMFYSSCQLCRDSSSADTRSNRM